MGFKSIIFTPEESLKWLEKNNAKGIIFSGGSASVYDIDAPKIPKEILNLNIPILGICFGMQWLAYEYDKNSVHAVKEGKSYDPVEINFVQNIKSVLFENLKEKINAWSSHGDSVNNVPAGFQVIATSKNGSVIEAMENTEKKFYGVQFHPEFEQTEDENII